MVNPLASLEKIKEAEISALIDLAIQSNSSGDEELKIGQTKMKSVMVYFLVRAGISPTYHSKSSMVSSNHIL